jgi:predicted RNA polymerase sigma factor
VHRVELSDETIRLGRLLQHELPDDPEVAGLVALMLLTNARRAARTGPNDELIPLEEQDRERWDRAEIDEGVAVITAALAKGAVGAYQLQAPIAAVHDAAARPEDTDWPEILALYGLLMKMADNPMVALSHAVAAAMVHGPSAGFALVAPLDDDDRIAGHDRLDAVRGHLHERAGDREAAIRHYLAAANRTANTAERVYLLTRISRLRE